ncbi:hypothetical protein DPMN_088067 [Dreissena polymorpha]|uniref:Uncharacterized protein n=1 Tax=Dreissena polymorpha TaxID=45954 RepID=A0A9D4KUD7_DREPO|nr:hypothetical protein DPMN_088067 [Dreissena polymorpha]
MDVARGQEEMGRPENKLTPLEEKVLTIIPKVSIEGVTADGDVFTENLKATCQACRSSVTKTQEEMLIASRERNAILKDINKNLEELVSLKKMKFLNAQLIPKL